MKERVLAWENGFCQEKRSGDVSNQEVRVRVLGQEMDFGSSD